MKICFTFWEPFWEGHEWHGASEFVDEGVSHSHQKGFVIHFIQVGVTHQLRMGWLQRVDRALKIEVNERQVSQISLNLMNKLECFWWEHLVSQYWIYLCLWIDTHELSWMVNVDVNVEAWGENHVNNLKPGQSAGEFKGVTPAEILLVLGPHPKLTLVVVSFAALFVNRHQLNLPLIVFDKIYSCTMQGVVSKIFW